MQSAFNSFSQRGTGKAHNEDAVRLNGQVHQGRVRKHGEVDTSEPRYFAVADDLRSGSVELKVQVHRAWLGPFTCALQQGPDLFKLLTIDVARVLRFSHSPIFRSLRIVNRF